VLEREDAEDGVALTLRLPPAELSRAERRFGTRLEEADARASTEEAAQQAAE